MKKNFVYFLVVLFLACNINNLEAQSINFTPTNNQTITCSGTNSSAYVGFSYGNTFTSYPPGISVAAYAKLTTYSGEYYWNLHNTEMGNAPQSFTLYSGTYTWTIDLYELFAGAEVFVKTASQTNTFYVNYKLYAANNFGSGSIGLESSTVSSGSSTYKIVGQSMSVEAIDQNDGSGYYRIWNTNGSNNSIWYKNGSVIQGATSRNLSYTVASGDNGSTLIADLRRICNLEFVSASGTVYVNGSHSSPYTTQAVEQNSVNATANNYSSGGIDYTFNHWTSGGSSYSSTITADANRTYTASYTRMASVSSMNFTLVSGYGDPPTMTWNEHQSTDVTKYRIYRTTKDIENDVLIAELNRGTTSFTDYDRIIRNSGNGILTFYRLRVLLTPENLESSEWGQTCYTIEFGKDNSNDKITTGMTLIPEDYSISAYPNPFNPTTTINYQLPKDGFVTIKVYDVLGREVAALVNENKTAGYYNVGFNASKLTSGIYIYTITANNFVQSKKLLLMK